MKRRVLALLAALSLVLFALFAALWVRSYVRLDILIQVRPRDVTTVSSLRGRIVSQIGWTMEDAQKQSSRRNAVGWRFEMWGNVAGSTTIDRSRGWQLLGFDAFNMRSGANTGEFVAIVPYWFLCLVTVVLPARVAYVRFQMRRREMLGLCARCGYDLRHASERCPECGATVPRAIAIPAQSD
jgi:hypothetical protein